MNQGLAGGLRAAMIALLLLVMAAVIVMVRAGQLLTHVSGAANLGADAQGRIWLTLNGALLRLAPDGGLQADFSLEQLGLGVPAALAPLPDGRVWVGSLSQERLVLLSPEGRQLAQAQPPPSAGGLFGTFHAAYEPRADRLVVTDTQNHRLLAFSGAGEFIAASGPALSVRFPNGVAADAQGRLLLADTNHNTLAWVLPDLRPAPASPPPPAPMDLRVTAYWGIWPVFVSVAPDGVCYASWHSGKLLRGGVLAYAADGRYLHALPLDRLAEPQALLARGDDVLLAFKTGQDFSLRSYDRDGRDLGPFGDAAVQAHLQQASTHANQLRRMQKTARFAVLLGAVALLACALRLRRQRDLAAAGSIVELRRSAPRGSTLLLAAALAGLVLLVVLAQLSGLGLSARAAMHAGHSGLSGPLLLARVLLPLLFGLAVLGGSAAWRSSAAFLDLQTRLMRRRMEAWAPHLTGMLAPGEKIEDYGVAPGVMRGRLLLATSSRLLLLPNAVASSRRPLWQAAWKDIQGPTLPPKPWWLWLLNPPATAVDIETTDGQPPLRVYAVSDLHVQQLVELVHGGLQRNFERTQPLRPAIALTAEAAAAATAPPARPLRGALLSLLFPGLGQLDQGRTWTGLGLMLFALLILSGGLISWYVALRRIADQPLQDPLLLALLYLPVLIYATWDAARYAGDGGATPLPRA